MANLKRRVEELERRQLAAQPSHSAECDEDALRIYDIQFHICGTDIDSHDLAAAPIAIRGKELHERRYGAIIPAYLNEHYKRYTSGSGEFEFAFCREPQAGDLLRPEHVWVLRSPRFNEAKFGRMISAWERQLPNLPCPLKFENERLFKRRPPARVGEEAKSEEVISIQAEAHWWTVECDAFSQPEQWVYGMTPSLWEEPDPRPLERMPTIGGVTFLGAVDGEHKCRPATEAELQRPETNEFFLEFLRSFHNGITSWSGLWADVEGESGPPRDDSEESDISQSSCKATP